MVLCFFYKVAAAVGKRKCGEIGISGWKTITNALNLYPCRKMKKNDWSGISHDERVKARYAADKGNIFVPGNGHS